MKACPAILAVHDVVDDRVDYVPSAMIGATRFNMDLTNCEGSAGMIESLELIYLIRQGRFVSLRLRHAFQCTPS